MEFTPAWIDLHLHTTASDGTLTPTELVARAKQMGVCAIAVTDHDTISGVREGMAAGEEQGIEVVAGVEIGIAHDPDRNLIETDILGYFVDPESEPLNTALDRLQDAKNNKLHKQIAVLARNGLEIDADDVLALAGGDTVRRPHIWKVLRARYPDLRPEDFFNRTSFGGEWHVSKDFSLTLEETVELIESAGGVPVLAHPGAYNDTFADGGPLIDPGVDYTIEVCAGAGVKGLEVLYSYDKNRPFYDKEPLIDEFQYGELIAHYAWAALHYGLTPTGGTDFHGSNKPQIEVGEVQVPASVLDDLKKVAGR